MEIKDPMSLFKRIKGKAFRNALKAAAHELVHTTEHLEKELHPTVTDYFLKNAFWNEIRKSENELIGEIDLEHVYSGICTYTHWFNNILNNPKKFAWLLSPVSDVAIGVREIKTLVFRNLVELENRESHKFTKQELVWAWVRAIGGNHQSLKKFHKFCKQLGAI